MYIELNDFRLGNKYSLDDKKIRIINEDLNQENIMEIIRNEDRVCICIYNEEFRYIALPASFHGEIFYIQNGNEIIISDNLYKLAARLGKLTINKSNYERFILKGYFSSEDTLFNEIHRFSNFSVYGILAGNFRKYEIPFTKTVDTEDEKQYQKFKDVLNEIVDRKLSATPCLLLSGGADSRLLLLLLKERIKDLQAINMQYALSMTNNLNDIILAEKMSKVVGCKLHKVCVGFGEKELDTLYDVAGIMPNCTHLSIGFDEMIHTVSKLRFDSIWTGQNMDNLYNLGPTGQFSLSKAGLGEALKRFYLSEEFFLTLEDVEGTPSKITSLVGSLGKCMLRIARKNTKINLPNSSDKLIDNFAHSPDYWPLSFTGREVNNKKLIRRNPFEVKQKLYKNKINYFNSGDAKVIDFLAYKYGINAIFPYTDMRMIDFFSGLHLTMKDVLYPKRYVYRYISEFIPKYGKEITQFTATKHDKKIFAKDHEALGINEWIVYLLDRTVFGNGLKKALEKVEDGLIDDRSPTRLQAGLSSFWIQTIINKLKEDYGVIVSK
ncbi:hypothetical protein [Selenomonas ruminantium]|uniref:asparagine synthase (glutamine-hydrolyzing) n=1 Tax=Selenomonas ruminantium TaxID=971 RepID=A0A1H0TZ78_SELRU|nr:hypothetical protein [Selenomonas ruminantium]SDP58876.1 hypothetical protein SAMN05216366_1277 [Selenomonas ruminantium]